MRISLVAYLAGVFLALFMAEDGLSDKQNEVERLIVEYSNNERVAEPLVLDEMVSIVARRWSEEMARRNAISHDGFPEKREAKFKFLFPEYNCIFAQAENVGVINVKKETSASDAAHGMVNAWMNSPPHKKNIMLPSHKKIGVGAFFKDDKMYATQLWYQAIAC